MAKELEGTDVVAFESRRAQEMAALLSKRGARVLSAKSMEEVPLSAQTEAKAFAGQLAAGQVDALVLLTGVGTKLLIQVLSEELGEESALAYLQSLALLCRGPKPALVLRNFKLTPTLVAPEPNTWRELISSIDEWGRLTTQRVTVQEYGTPNPELLEALTTRASTVTRLPVYGWTMPSDVGPLKEAVTALCEGKAKAALFTSAQQIEHLVQVAAQLGKQAELIAAMNQRVVVASIGPITSAALERHGMREDTHPEHPKMGQLVSHLARNWQSLSAQKQAR